MGKKINWHRTSSELAKVPPDIRYPNGIDLSVVPKGHDGGVCLVTLLRPADGIGCWVITCEECGLTVACTTAGRIDDPRSMTMPCRRPQ
jgi:hypothetical protein